MTGLGWSLVSVIDSAPSNVWEWFRASETRTVSGSIPHNLLITLGHAVGAVALAVAVAVPSAAWLAHRRKARTLATTIVNLGRIIPTVTILAIAVVVSLRAGYGFAPWPIVIALFALSLPPIFAATYTGVVGAPEDAVAAARAMGMTDGQVLRRVELPVAIPLIAGGIRTALTQAIATEALGAMFGGDGLGLYVKLGIDNRQNYQTQGGALLIAGTAIAADIVVNVIGRRLTPAPLRRTRQTPKSAARQTSLSTSTAGGPP